jgi:hypothetical protein
MDSDTFRQLTFGKLFTLAFQGFKFNFSHLILIVLF